MSSNDTEEKFQSSQGPFDFDDLQGVWFMAESSPKAFRLKPCRFYAL